MNHRREHASKEETLSKTTPALCLHNVTTTDLLLALADACDVMLYIIQFIVMVPSSSYYIIRPEILILQ